MNKVVTVFCRKKEQTEDIKRMHTSPRVENGTGYMIRIGKLVK